MVENTTPPSMNPSNVYAEGEVSPSEAILVMTNLTKENLKVEYDGPGSLGGRQIVKPQDAAEVLNTALEYPAQMTSDERLENKDAMEALGFDHPTYGKASVVQELVEGNAEQGAETPVYLLADFNESVANKNEGGSGYAVIVDNLQTAIKPTEEDNEATLTLRGDMQGEPTNQEDIQELAKTVEGDLEEAYKTVADL